MDQKKHKKHVPESFELAYYNIIAGACFAVALKYAGTAREEAYKLLLGYHDTFSQLSYNNSEHIDLTSFSRVHMNPSQLLLSNIESVGQQSGMV